MVTMDSDTIATIASLLTSQVAGLIALGAYLHADIRRVESRVDRLDDRVHQLATGLRPIIDRAERTDSAP